MFPAGKKPGPGGGKPGNLKGANQTGNRPAERTLHKRSTYHKRHTLIDQHAPGVYRGSRETTKGATTMGTTVNFLDAVKSRRGVISDYQLAKIIGVSQQTVSRYRVGKDYLGDSTAIRVAELLEIDPAIVVAAAHAERAKKPEERRVWEGIIQKLGGAAALLLIGIGAISVPSPASAAPSSQNAPMSIM